MPELPQQPAESGVSVNTGFPRPEIAPGGAVRGLGEAADATEQMATGLASRLSEIRRTTQFNLAESSYRMQADDLSYKILRDPALRSDPDKARAAMGEQLKPIQEKLHEQYPAADWDGMLTRNMRIWGDARTRVIGHAAIDNLERDTKDEIKARTPGAVADALTLSDPKDRQKAVTDHMQLIGIAEKGGLLTKGEADLERQSFSYQVAKGQFDQQARANPGAILAMDKPPEGVPPEWLEGAKKVAIEKLDASHRASEAFVTANLGSQEQAIIAAKLRGESVSEPLQKYMSSGGSQKFYEAMGGVGHWAPNNPELREVYIKRLQAATPHDVPYIEDEVMVARGNMLLSSSDAAIILGAGTRAKAEKIDDLKVAKENARAAAMDALFPATKVGGFGIADFHPKVIMERFNADWNAAMAGAKTPAEVEKAEQEILKKYAPAIRNSKAFKDAVLRGVPGAGPAAAATPALTVP